MKTKNKFLISIIAIMLSCVIMFTTIAVYNNTINSSVVSASVRTVELSQTGVEAQSILEKYEDSTFTIVGQKATFTGYQTLDSSLLSEIDEINEMDIEALNQCKVKYEYTYNAANNIVTISAVMHNEYGDIIMDELSGLAFWDENGEIDAIISIDESENILLSDLIDKSNIENIGWLSRLFKAVVVAVVVTVAVAVTAVTAGIGAAAVVAVATTAIVSTTYDLYEQAQAAKNYQHNKNLESSVTGLVNGQGYYFDWKFGVRTFDYNGCGVIATYNVMYLLGDSPKLSEVAYEIESKQGVLVWGYAGTDPTHPYEYFKEKGIKVTQYYDVSDYDSALDKMGENQYALVCYWNDKSSISEGAHFVAVSKNSSDRFVVYNDSNFNKAAVTYSNLTNIMNNGKGKMIVGLIVN